MAKRRANNFRWNPSHTWEINIEALLQARRAGAEWPAAKRAKKSRQMKKWHARQKREAAARQWHKWVNRPRKQEGVAVLAGNRRIDRILRIMLPGEWYAQADLRQLSGLPGNVGYTRSLGEAKGWLERAQDAGAVYRPTGRPILLWRLTPLGEAARAFAIMLE